MASYRRSRHVLIRSVDVNQRRLKSRSVDGFHYTLMFVNVQGTGHRATENATQPSDRVGGI